MVNDAKANALTVKTGDSVEFRNDDRAAHNVFSRTPGFEFDLGTIRR
jgi:plastocyanin